MSIFRCSYTFPIRILVLLAVSALLLVGCDKAPAEQEAPAPSRAAADGMAQPAVGGK